MSPGEGLGGWGQDPGAIRSRAEGLEGKAGARDGWGIGMGVGGGIHGVREVQCEEGEKIRRRVEETVHLVWRRIPGVGKLPSDPEMQVRGEADSVPFHVMQIELPTAAEKEVHLGTNISKNSSH